MEAIESSSVHALGNAVSGWQLHMTAAADFMLGASCIAVAAVLAYLAKHFKELPFRIAYAPFGGFLVLTGLAHASSASGIFEPRASAHRFLLTMSAICFLGTVALLLDLVQRVSRLARERESQQRQVVSDRGPDSFRSSVSSAEMLALQRPASEPRPGRLGDLPLILVVEDNPDMNRFVTSSLSGEFRVAPVFDGRQALARLETLTPDLIVTDLMMPHMSGEEFVKALRESAELGDIPVLVLTARDDIELRVRVLSDGAQDWLTKPFTAKELVARARNLISARRARVILRSELATREFDVGELANQLVQRKRRLESSLDSLGHALEQAKLASRFKTSLLRLVSHELRTPLGALQLQLERLSGEHRGPLNDAQQQLIVRMRRSLTRLADTIQSLLEYARIETGRLDLCVESFDARELARGVLDDFAAQAETKGIFLRLSGVERPQMFETDSRLLRLVLVNLVSNALKFTDEGEISIDVQSDSEHCRLQVRDTGVGISSSQQTAVFEPFFQGESARHAQHTQGAGLGLSLVREMLHALGGSIELESAIAAGSTFRISVPRAALPRAQSVLTEPSRNTA